MMRNEFDVLFGVAALRVPATTIGGKTRRNPSMCLCVTVSNSTRKLLLMLHFLSTSFSLVYGVYLVIMIVIMIVPKARYLNRPFLLENLTVLHRPMTKIRVNQYLDSAWWWLDLQCWDLSSKLWIAGAGCCNEYHQYLQQKAGAERKSLVESIFFTSNQWPKFRKSETKFDWEKFGFTKFNDERFMEESFGRGCCLMQREAYSKLRLTLR